MSNTECNSVIPNQNASDIIIEKGESLVVRLESLIETLGGRLSCVSREIPIEKDINEKAEDFMPPLFQTIRTQQQRFYKSLNTIQDIIAALEI